MYFADSKLQCLFQLEHEMNSSSVPSPVTSPQGKKDRGTRYA